VPELPNLDTVLSAYLPPIASAHWTPLGSAGGFSGSRLWRGLAANGRAFALKMYPSVTDADRIRQVHNWMAVARGAGLDFVPAVEPNRNGETIHVSSNRVCEVTAWMPGHCDFHEDPKDEKLIAAVSAVARIHETWGEQRREAPCPAIGRRWRAMLDGEEMIRSDWRPRSMPDDPVFPHVHSAWRLLPLVLSRLRPILSPWLDRLVPLQPCIGDVWHDHILFVGERVTGVIDYAAAKMDHVAADLARLLGSLVPDEPKRMQRALAAYSMIRPLPNPELVDVLDTTGVVGAIVNWLKRLERDVTRDRQAIARRLEMLVGRLTLTSNVL
jgi:Ser/Thr protein kinase RdoA (MazF antagonist)